jgi:8-oxo-dGTP pyrophosphatase MutT (NUDIX family)
VSPPADDAAGAVLPSADVEAPATVRRGGAQIIPRPSSWRPGGPPPWAQLPPERRRPCVDDVRQALATGRPPRRSALEGADVRASAVLAPLYERDGEAVVVLTRRAQHLRAHRGEVSFPGGGQDPGEDLRVTALREAHEEIGLHPRHVELIGQLDHLQTVTSQSFIVPFVGVLAEVPELVPSPHEVEHVLHVPLSELLDDGVYHAERWGLEPLDRELSFFEVEGDTIWGATAAMLRNLLELVTAIRRE